MAIHSFREKGHGMDTLQCIQERRAVKHYDPTHRMTQEEIQTLLEASMLAPTAFNIQNWRFVLVQDPQLRHAIRGVSWNQAQITDASLLVILCADLAAWAKDPQRYWRLAPREVQEYVVPAIGRYYQDREQIQRDEAMRSCGLAAQTMMLAAKAMGYDSCPMDGFDFDAVAQLINLPRDHVIAMFVVIGKATAPAKARSGPLSMNEVVIQDRFPGV